MRGQTILCLKGGVCVLNADQKDRKGKEEDMMGDAGDKI